MNISKLLPSYTRKEKATILGLDPSPSGTTGYFRLELEDSRIVRCTHGVGQLYDVLSGPGPPTLVVIDAPLALPYKGFRRVERKAIKTLGVRLLPGSLKGMRALTRLGLSLLWLHEESASLPIETHPGSTRLILDLSLEIPKSDTNDAFIAAVTGYCLANSNSIVITGVDGVMVFPRKDCRRVFVELFKRCFDTTF
ncbi:MAG: hypothetical protein F7C38_06245 [Desulfurococcales archaeon]|nr:hypothetical protein [Desulfurococcales archaeon]